MKKIRILDKTGDTEIDWDDSAVTADAKALAEAAFEKAQQGGTAVLTKRANGGEDMIIRKFSDIEDNAEAIFIPAIVAG